MVDLLRRVASGMPLHGVSGKRIQKNTGFTASGLSLKPLGQDSVRFSGSPKQDAQLLKKYGISVDAVQTQLPEGVSLSKAAKRRLIVQALETYEHAAKKRLLNEQLIKIKPDTNHVSGRNFSSTVVLENGITATAVNSEFSRDDILCGERSGIVSALNQAIHKVSLEALKSDPQALETLRQGMKVKHLVMSGAHRHKGENSADESKDSLSSPPPCSDCQAWMNTSEYFSPDTQIVTLDRALGPTPILQMMPLKKMLPFWNDSVVSRLKPTIDTQEPSVDAMPVQFSPRASAIQGLGIDEVRVKALVKKAKEAYQANSLAEVSRKNAAVAALLMPMNEIVTATRFDITARWYNDPAKTVLEKGFREMQERGFTTNPEKGAQAVAFAFYSDYPQPTVNTLGYLAQLERGNGADKTLIIRIEDNAIQVRTIRDMMPEVYMSARVPREGGKS